MKRILLTCLMVFLTSCESNENKVYAKKDTKEIQGVVYEVVSDKPISGRVIERHANGLLKKESTFENGKKVVVREWTIDGSPDEAWYYKNDVLERREYNWHSNGQVSSEWEYLSSPSHYFRWHYYENGQIKAQQEMRGNYAAGIARKWNKDGVLLSEDCYNSDLSKHFEISYCTQ